MNLTDLALSTILLRIGLLIAIGLFIYYTIGRFGRKTVQAALTKRKMGLGTHPHTLTHEEQQRIDTISSLFDKIARLVIILVLIGFILSEFGLNIGPLIAGASVLGVALGFGSQSLVKDFLAGIFIAIENHYGKGDIVELAGVRGKVVDFSLRRTVLRDMEGTEHSVPNGQITLSSNFTKDWSYVNLEIPINAKNDLETVFATLSAVAKSFSNDPEWKVYIYTQPTVLGIESFNNPGLVVKLQGKVDAEQKWAIERELRKRIKIAFDQAGIDTPYSVPTSTN